MALWSGRQELEDWLQVTEYVTNFGTVQVLSKE
jgi:hypothetical protein